MAQPSSTDRPPADAAIQQPSTHPGEARTAAILDSMAVGYLVVDEQWIITYVNAEGRRVLGAAGRDLSGHNLWELFPAAVGTVFETQYRAAVETGEITTLDAFYPAPLDAWFEVRAVPQDDGLALYFLDITARRNAQDAAELSARRLLALSRVTAALAEAQDIPTLVSVIAERGLVAMGCDGGAVAIADPEDGDMLLSYITTSYGPGTQADFGRLPVSTALPVCEAYTTGQRVLIPDLEAALAYSPLMEQVVSSTGSPAYASLPLSVAGEVVGVLTAGWQEPQPFDDEQLEVLDTFAAQCAQALERIIARQAERAASAAVERFSEAMQRSLLTSPAEPNHLQVAVRYSPAAAEAQVGGDWYDAFMTSAGSTSLVIGDVTGHDRHAAAAMGQLRNILRGIGFTIGDPPALILSALDRAAHGLDVHAMASVILAAVEQPAGHAAAGTRVLRWSNAGHPPPLLIEPGNAPRFLTTTPDLLIGIDPNTSRQDHTVVLVPGTTVLLYTDGLIERRGASLQAGMDWLATAVGELGDLTLEELCDALLTAVGNDTDDDIALLALRAHPEDTPRPAEAGPGHDPLHEPSLSSKLSG